MNAAHAVIDQEAVTALELSPEPRLHRLRLPSRLRHARAARRGPIRWSEAERMGQLRQRPADKATGIDMAVVVAVFVQDAHGRVLMHRRPGTDLWTLPSGECAGGESLGHAVMRHVAMQAGIDIRVMGLAGIYCDPRADGEEAPLVACVRARPHDLAPAAALSDARWIEPNRLAAIPMPAPERRRVRHALQHDPVPFIDHGARKRTLAHRAALPRRGLLQRWLLKRHLHSLIDRP